MQRVYLIKLLTMKLLNSQLLLVDGKKKLFDTEDNSALAIINLIGHVIVIELKPNSIAED